MTEAQEAARGSGVTAGGSIGAVFGSPRPRDIILALLIGAIVAAGGAAAVLRQDPLYFSRATLLIDQPRAVATSPDEGPIVKLSRLRFKYAGLVSTSRIAGPVARDLHLSVSRVRRAVRGVIDPLSLLLFVDVRMDDRSLVLRVAQQTAMQVIADAQQEQTSLGVQPKDRFEFSLVDQASVPDKIAPSGNRATAVAAVGGSLAAAAVYVLMRLLFGRRRRA